jgi:hypothetical protein
MCAHEQLGGHNARGDNFNIGSRFVTCRKKGRVGDAALVKAIACKQEGARKGHEESAETH